MRGHIVPVWKTTFTGIVDIDILFLMRNNPTPGDTEKKTFGPSFQNSYTLENEHLEHKYGGLVDDDCPFRLVISRFQPLIFRGLSIIYFDYPVKTNISPENYWLEDDTSFQTVTFQVTCPDGPTIMTLLHGKINPKDWQVASPLVM